MRIERKYVVAAIVAICLIIGIVVVGVLLGNRDKTAGNEITNGGTKQ